MLFQKEKKTKAADIKDFKKKKKNMSTGKYINE